MISHTTKHISLISLSEREINIVSDLQARGYPFARICHRQRYFGAATFLLCRQWHGSQLYSNKTRLRVLQAVTYKVKDNSSPTGIEVSTPSICWVRRDAVLRSGLSLEHPVTVLRFVEIQNQCNTVLVLAHVSNIRPSVGRVVRIFHKDLGGSKLRNAGLRVFCSLVKVVVTCKHGFDDCVYVSASCSPSQRGYRWYLLR